MMQTEILTLAQAARPINHADWGSERQIRAQNAFFNKCEALGLDTDDPFFNKATAEEMIDYALLMLNLPESESDDIKYFTNFMRELGLTAKHVVGEAIFEDDCIEIYNTDGTENDVHIQICGHNNYSVNKWSEDKFEMSFKFCESRSDVKRELKVLFVK